MKHLLFNKNIKLVFDFLSVDDVMKLASRESVAGFVHGTRNAEVPGSRHALTVVWVCLSTVLSSTVPPCL